MVFSVEHASSMHGSSCDGGVEEQQASGLVVKQAVEFQQVLTS